MGAISDWVKAGGIAFFEAGGGALNEFNSTGRARCGNSFMHNTLSTKDSQNDHLSRQAQDRPG
jgi:hypothetical protein